MTRVLVCGGRDYADRDWLYGVLDRYHAQVPFAVLIHGDAQGADTLAKEWAESRGVPVEHYPAQWDRDGRAAGPIRNQQMLTEGRPDVCIAFPRANGEWGSGTTDMVKRAMRALGADHVLRIPGRAAK